jgi:regulator of sigma E protease
LDASLIQSPGVLMAALAFLCAIGPLVFIHEMGHYLAGRLFGVKAEAFSIGFGREIAGFTDARGTRWKFGWLPLGGYVRFAGDMNPASQPDAAWLSLPAAERAQTFQAKPLWQRAIIVAAGPAVNLILAVLILAAFAHAYGVDRTPAVVGTVVEGGPGAKAGLRPGDRIVAIDGRDIGKSLDAARYALIRPGERATIRIERAGRQIEGNLAIGVIRQRDRFGNEYRIGRIGIGSGDPVLAPVGLAAAPAAGVRMTVDIISGTLETLGQIISGRRSMDELGGPIRIAKMSGEQMALGLSAFVWLVAMLSINLGFINLLPVPMLDGGHLFFYAIEAIRRRPLEPRVQEWAFRGGLAAVLTLMLIVTFNDLSSVGLWQRLAGLIG